MLLGLAVLRLPSTAVLFQEVVESLRVIAKWSDADLASWELLGPAFERLISNETLRGLGKAVRLQYEHTNILTETYLVTDVRPVFDASGTAPQAAIICHTLRVAFTSDGRTKHLAFALDNEDLRNLIQGCERALRKADALRAFLKAPTELPSKVAGGDDNAA